ncbi:hypothetical protein TNCV_2752471, partial [Trichonephila clavipes]
SEKNLLLVEAIEKVALQVEEDKSSNVLASTSVRRVAKALICLVQLSRRSCKTSSVTIHKLQFVQELLHMILRLDICSLQFLLVWKLIQNGLGISLSDRRSPLSFGRFGEYSQLPNLGNRQSAFHLTSSLHSPKVTVCGGFSASLYLTSVFFEELGCWRSSNMFITDSDMHRYYGIKLFQICKHVSAFHA